MKKNIYLIIITLITIGCIIGGMLYHTGGFSGMRLDKSITRKTETIFQQDGEVTAVAVDSEVMDVRFRTGEKLEIAYGGNENLKPEISLDNGTLTITQRGKAGNHFNLFGFGKNGAKLDVTLPSGTKLEKFASRIDVCDMEIAQLAAAEAVISGNTGDIDITDAAFGSTEITLNTGDLNVNDSALGSGTITLDTGDIDVKRSAFADLRVSAGMGDVEVELADERSRYAIDLSTDLGEVEIFGNDEGRSYSQQSSESGGPSLTVTNHVGDIEVK
ncbi:MAG: DUF4097 family beta strand repeat protein [Eubacterium sp.]|nr:DUF4097 family beta strand repeat protein [Eubacterium sp.]